MKVARLIIRDYAGVEAADIKVPPGGILITGGNARGKTSIYRALRAALKAQGVDPEAIRRGAEKSEILVDLSSLHVRTIIRPKGEETVVMDDAGQVLRKPRTILNDIFGDELDPLAFYQAKDKDRRRMIYEVLPMKVTEEDLKRWTNGMWNDPTDVHGPGLEVVERFRLAFYNRRTKANADAEMSAATAQRVQGEADKLLLESGPAPTEPTSVEDAQRRRDEAQRALSALEGKQQGFEQARRAAAPTRDRIAELRQLAAGQLQSDPPILCLGLPDQYVRSAAEAHARVEILSQMVAVTNDLANRFRSRDNQNQEADRLSDSLAGIGSMNVPAEEVAAARAALEAAEGVLVRARGVKIYAGYLSAAEDAAKKAAADAELAAALDDVVKNLTTVAPRELAERSGGIPGLVVGEQIALDGVTVDTLSGLEQLQFAIDLAKRVRGSKGKVLLVDGMERVDDDELGAFLKMAVKGGWQVIGTRVTKGKLDIVAVAEDDEVDGG